MRELYHEGHPASFFSLKKFRVEQTYTAGILSVSLLVEEVTISNCGRVSRRTMGLTWWRRVSSPSRRGLVNVTGSRILPPLQVPRRNGPHISSVVVHRWVRVSCPSELRGTDLRQLTG